MELSIGGRLPQSVDWDFHALCTELAIVDQYVLWYFSWEKCSFPMDVFSIVSVFFFFFFLILKINNKIK